LMRLFLASLQLPLGIHVPLKPNTPVFQLRVGVARRFRPVEYLKSNAQAPLQPVQLLSFMLAYHGVAREHTRRTDMTWQACGKKEHSLYPPADGLGPMLVEIRHVPGKHIAPGDQAHLPWVPPVHIRAPQGKSPSMMVRT